jgi:hypothetical protein
LGQGGVGRVAVGRVDGNVARDDGSSRLLGLQQQQQQLAHGATVTATATTGRFGRGAVGRVEAGGAQARRQSIAENNRKSLAGNGNKSAFGSSAPRRLSVAAGVAAAEEDVVGRSGGGRARVSTVSRLPVFKGRVGRSSAAAADDGFSDANSLAAILAEDGPRGAITGRASAVVDVPRESLDRDTILKRQSLHNGALRVPVAGAASGRASLAPAIQVWRPEPETPVRSTSSHRPATAATSSSRTPAAKSPRRMSLTAPAAAIPRASPNREARLGFGLLEVFKAAQTPGKVSQKTEEFAAALCGITAAAPAAEEPFAVSKELFLEDFEPQQEQDQPAIEPVVVPATLKERSPVPSPVKVEAPSLLPETGAAGSVSTTPLIPITPALEPVEETAEVSTTTAVEAPVPALPVEEEDALIAAELQMIEEAILMREIADLEGQVSAAALPQPRIDVDPIAGNLLMVEKRNQEKEDKAKDLPEFVTRAPAKAVRPRAAMAAAGFNLEFLNHHPIAAPAPVIGSQVFRPFVRV